MKKNKKQETKKDTFSILKRPISFAIVVGTIGMVAAKIISAFTNKNKSN